VKIKHPKFDTTIEIPEKDAYLWAAQGWILVKTPKPRKRPVKKKEEAGEDS